MLFAPRDRGAKQQTAVRQDMFSMKWHPVQRSHGRYSGATITIPTQSDKNHVRQTSQYGAVA
jgi:hypothetical protein